MQTTAQEPGLLETLKERLNPSTLMQRLHITQDMLIDMALYGGIGFLIGFLLKKYGKFIFIVVLCIVALIIAQQAGIISVQVYWTKIQEFLGMQTTGQAPEGFFTSAWDWAKTHLSLVISFSMGFLIGLRVG